MKNSIDYPGERAPRRKKVILAAKEKMLAGVQEAQKTAKDAGSQITIGEIAEAARQGGRPV